jgi:hypothetical protein
MALVMQVLGQNGEDANNLGVAETYESERRVIEGRKEGKLDKII